jgi:hypothetical protein
VAPHAKGKLMKKSAAGCGVLAALILVGDIAFAAAPPIASAQDGAVTAPLRVGIRRLTETQYRHSIADVFGSEIKIEARFEPEKREDGLLALGSAQASLTSSGFEQYFALASSIATQVLQGPKDAPKLDALLGCTPANPAQADAACARSFITRYGERLLRRPLSELEIQARLETAAVGAQQSGDFYAGLQLALTSLLIAPEFLFRIESAEPDAASPGQYRLDAYTKAARISFLFWDTAPDEELLSAARSGAIHTQAELERQLARMIASPRFRQGAAAFFTDMLQLEGFENLVKEPAVYPKFNQSVADAAREQTRVTTIDLLIEQRRDYRELFTSNETFINRYLAAIYQVPFNFKGGEWMRYTFPESSERAGILTQVSFLSLFAHPGSSSPTRRGIKIYEIFMCEPTPDPPADVDFSKVRDSTKGTVRGRLLDHMENTGCTACHRRSDPPGLALEHFDGLGQLRTLENGAPIDVSAELGDVKVSGARGVANYLHDSPKIPACLVRNVYAYGVGRKPGVRERDYLAEQAKRFATNGYRVPELMVQIAATPECFKVVIPSDIGSAAVSPAAALQQTPGVSR